MPCFVSGQNCNDAHNEDLKRNISQQGANKEIAPENAHATNETAPLPADLAGLVASWATFPEHIRAAIMALAGTVRKP